MQRHGTDILSCTPLWKQACFFICFCPVWTFYFGGFLLRSLVHFCVELCYSGLLQNSFYIWMTILRWAYALEEHSPCAFSVGLFSRQRVKSWSPAAPQFFHFYLHHVFRDGYNVIVKCWGHLPLYSYLWLSYSSAHCGLWFRLYNFWTSGGLYEGIKTYSYPVIFNALLEKVLYYVALGLAHRLLFCFYVTLFLYLVPVVYSVI